MIRQEFLELLRCPESQQKLVLADDQLVSRLNQAIGAGRIRNRAGDRVEEKLDAGLVREDRLVIYPIIDEIPILLQDDGILLDQIAGGPSSDKTNDS